MNGKFFATAFTIGLLAVAWVGVGFAGTSALALAVTAVIAAVYGLGAFELRQFRATTAGLAAALADIPQPMPDINAWITRAPPALQNLVRLRIEGERTGLPGPALTPYLVGLLVMLGMLGTFLGMVVTFKGAVFALEGSTDLQAIRSALAEPIKGLGLSFGTSVAGVAASAMLGLMSTLCRRERLEVGRQLDNQIATVFRPLSLAHQRRATFTALQAQAQALPDVVDRLQAMMDSIERRSQQLDAQLREQQAQFHRDVSVAYTGLAHSVGQSLTDSLVAGAKAAGESIRPVVEAAMSEMSADAKRMHERVFETTQAQLTGLASAFSATAHTVSDGWMTALQAHASTSDKLASSLSQSLAGFTHTFEQRAQALLATVNETVTQSQSDQAKADRLRLEAWSQSLASMAASLHSEWQRVSSQTLDQQQTLCLTLEKTAGEITERTSHHASQTLDDIARLLAQSEELVRSRTESEARWTQQQGERMDQWVGLWRSELATLRDDEATRGQAAVARLGELQAALASHLATLGCALEAPMTRLMQTASEAPQAAAQVIAQLRQEMTRLTERDNLALEERAGLMAQISTLLQSVNQASGEHQAAIDSLVTSTTALLAQAGSQFEAMLGAQASKTADTAAHVNSSAIELASLGEAFSHGVALFSAANDKLMDSLQRVESALTQSAARSDEQLAYYVAQAREVIDLSISSQQEIVEDLRRLKAKQPALAEGAAG